MLLPEELSLHSDGGSCSGDISRRSFLKTAGIGAQMLAVPAWARVLGANDRINVAMIGIGCRGTDQLSLVLQHRQIKADVEVVALCDVYQKRLNMAARKVPGAKTYTHHQEVLQRQDIDAVFIATPDHWHAPITLAALESGKDVYVEKPMTHTAEEGLTVARRVKELHRVLQVGVQGLSWRRWHKIRDIIQSGMIGQVVSVRSIPPRDPTPRAKNTLTGSNGSAPLHKFPSMQTASSVSANTGTTRAASPRIFTITSLLPSTLRWQMTFRRASPAWVVFGSTTTGVRFPILS